MKKLRITDAFEHFSSKHNDYKKLGEQICRQINDFLRQEKILSLNTDYRIKEKDKVIEKIKRKHYDDPINQIEDFCGIRVVCFYSKDIGKICTFLDRNFVRLTAIDKSSTLNHNRIGYRSWHYIVNLKDTICQEEYYKKLKDLKAEIQIRTLLMHSWAEMEHKLQYKSEFEVPQKIRRKLHLLSALLELGDYQIENLLDERNKYIDELKNSPFNDDKELNIYALSDFLLRKCHSREDNINHTKRLLVDMTEYKLKFSDLSNLHSILENVIIEFEKEASLKHTRAGLFRIYLDLTNDEFYNNRKQFLKTFIDYEKRIKLYDKWRPIFKEILKHKK